MHNIAAYTEFAERILKAPFNNIELLVTALTHRSYVNEHRKTAREHNERLEFLGDAVLELVVTEYLYKNYEEQEGVLTNWRSALVRTESISEASKRLGVEPLLRLSRGERRGSERARSQILANTYEAIIGAIYLDQGYEAAAQFIEHSLLTTFQKILESGSWLDAKSHLQELAQNQRGSTPTYKVLKEDGPDHEKVFTVGVYVNGKLLGKGQGASKQIGQQNAAKKALDTLKLTSDK